MGEYSDILKRAGRMAFQRRSLWVLGLFAGGLSGLYVNFEVLLNSWVQTLLTHEITDQQVTDFLNMLQRNGGVVLAAIALFALVQLALIVLYVAARGGLVHLVNEAAEGRPVRLRDGWRVGFSKWGRVFGVYVCALAPIIAVSLIGVIVYIASGVAAFRAGQASISVGTVVGAACIISVVEMIASVLSIVLMMAAEVGRQHVVLDDMHAIDAMKAGLTSLRERRGVVTMSILLDTVMLGFSFVVSGVVTVAIAPVQAFQVSSGALPDVVIALTLIVSLIASLLMAITVVFYDAAWTIFFRKISGREHQRVETVGMFGPPPDQPAPSGYQLPSYVPRMYVPPVPDATPADLIDDKPPAPPAPVYQADPYDPIPPEFEPIGQADAPGSAEGPAHV